MRAIVSYLIGAVLMVAVGAGCLAAGLLDREMVRALEGVVSEHYGEPHAIFDHVATYYDRASVLPWVGSGPANDIHARDAAVHYWQGQYGEVVPDAADPVANVPSDNVTLQFIVANSVFREGTGGAVDRAALIALLDKGINAYRTVLKNSTRHEDAAYNYEYLSRLRDEIEQGRRKGLPVPEPHGTQGRAGSRPTSEDARKFNLYVPLDEQEIEKNKAPAAGKGVPIKRKG
jgi:hypothetical protein